MGLENLKSIFVEDFTENSPSPKGRHGGLTNETPSTPHNEHSELGDILKINSIGIGNSPLNNTQEGDTVTFPMKTAGVDILTNNPVNNPNGKGDRIQIRKDNMFQNLGKNNRLGDGDFNWTSLYNSNHTPIEERTPIDIGRVDESGNAILINTLRSGMGTLSNLDIQGYSSDKLDNFRGFNRGNEPYIVQPIGSDRYTTLTNRDTLPLNRALDDTSRLLKFYGTGAGLAFIAKENFTNILFGSDANKQPFKSDKILFPPLPNPIQGNTSFLNITNQFRDLGHVAGSLRKPTVIEYSSRGSVALPFGKLGDKFLKVLGVETDVQIPTLKKSAFYNLTGTVGSAKSNDHIASSGIEKGVESFWDDDILPPLEDQMTYISEGDFYVRFKDLRNNNFIYFRGYVTGITENLNPSYNSVNYIGRSESTYTYERTERDLSFNLRVLPANKNQFNKMWEKINYLTSLTYPEYMEDKNFIRMKAPFTELYMGHIGTPDKGQFGFIKSLSYTVNESGDWDSASNLPRVIDVAISYQILNKKTPSLFKSNDNKTLDNLTEFYNLPK